MPSEMGIILSPIWKQSCAGSPSALFRSLLETATRRSAAPWLSPHDPLLLAPAQRLKPASAQFLLGTDGYGRDVLSRILYGGRISLLIGLGAAIVSIGIGLVIGLVSGFFKWIDAIMMRVMDGLMAIPSILLAIALITLTRPGLGIVIVAIVIPEVPRVVRVVRAVVLSIRSQP